MNKHLFRSILLASVASAFAGNVRDVEYWFDSDIASRLRKTAVVDSLSMIVPTTMLSPGLHTFHLQPIDSDGNRGILHSTPIWIAEEQRDTTISRYGIWIDSRIVKSAPVESLHVIDCLDVASLSPGIHSLAVAPFNAENTPGKLMTSVFFIPEQPKDISTSMLLIWKDNDPSSIMTVAGSSISALAIDISELHSGLHFVNVLPVTKNGEHGALHRSAFYLPKIDHPIVGAYRYWIDNNSPVETGQSSTPLHISVDVSTLSSGTHTFHIQAMSPAGEWGDEYSAAFEMPVDLDITDWEILKALHEQLTAIGWESPWNMDDGPAGAVSFTGLTSREGRVTGIKLDNLGTSGAFPSAALEFPKLTELNLSHDGLDGQLDSLVSDLGEAGAGSELKTINLSGNRLTGNASKFTSGFPVLTELNLSDNNVSEVDPPIPATAMESLDLSRQIIGDTVVLDLSNLTVDAVSAIIPTIFTYRHETQSYDSEYELILSEQPPYRIDWYTTPMSGLKFSVGESLTVTPIGRDNIIRVPEGAVMMLGRICGGVNANPSRPVRVEYESGDVDLAGGLSPADVQATILYIFGEYGWRPFNFTAADTYRDDVINVQDVVVTVNLLLDKTLSAALPIKASSVHNHNDKESAQVSVYCDDGKIILESAEDIAAVSASFYGDITWQFKDFGMETASQTGATVAYSLSGDVVPAGTHIIGQYDGEVSIESFRVSSVNAEELATVVADSSSNTGRIIGDEELKYVYPDGTVSDSPRQGVNIVIIGGKARKIIVK